MTITDKSMQKDSIYNPKYVADLFDSMASSYGLTNYISSFGFSEKWRKECISRLQKPTEPLIIYDLMSGMGELWIVIKKYRIPFKQINAVDISPNMNRIAKINQLKVKGELTIIEQDILKNKIEPNAADWVVSSFGLKTFNHEQLSKIALEVERILKPGGSFSFVEISVPDNGLLKYFYMFYLNRIIPLIGLIFQGNSNDYRMLGIYTSAFGSCNSFHKMLINAGLESKFEKLFFGCASITWGTKTITNNSYKT
jgi:demethylmenaquinone methyltransferase/2-methoxy-6-polyprenyl-1,4-benzoquinol methylase